MPTVRANDIDVYYEQQGAGEPLVLLPYLAIDQACYAFQVADYAKHYTCISVDLRGAGQTSKPPGAYTTELLADDVAAFMQAAGVDRAHITGLSLGAATGMWLAAKHPDKVKTLSLHSAWPKTDPFLRTVVEGWRVLAKGLGSVTEMVILGIFPGASPRSCTPPSPTTSTRWPSSCAAVRCRTWTRSCVSPRRSSATTPRRSWAISPRPRR
jgi:pimeloyl-ACP methyl ester carboxylesterase